MSHGALPYVRCGSDEVPWHDLGIEHIIAKTTEVVGGDLNRLFAAASAAARLGAVAAASAAASLGIAAAGAAARATFAATARAGAGAVLAASTLGLRHARAASETGQGHEGGSDHEALEHRKRPLVKG
jgi:hypothetical protein